MYACVAERDAAADGAVMVVCTVCGMANFIDWFATNHALGWRNLWREVAQIPNDERNAGARLTILAGPSSDIAALALVCLDNQEPRVIAQTERVHDEIDATCLHVRNDEQTRTTRARRRRKDLAEIRAQFENARSKVGAS